MIFTRRFFAIGLCLILLSACSESNKVGQQLPDIKPDYIGDAANLNGKPVLLEFWATWCPPCRASIPHLNKISLKYGPRGLVVLGISREDRIPVEKMISDLKMTYYIALDPGGDISRQFGINAIPHAFLVDRTGKIIWEGHPALLTDDDIEKVLN